MNNEFKSNYRVRNVVTDVKEEADATRYLVTPVSEPKELVLAKNLTLPRRIFVGERYKKR